MLEKMVSNDTMRAMQKALEGSALRQKVIANNLANVDTPGYKSLDVSFEDELKKAMSSAPGSSLQLTNTNPRHFQINGQPANLDTFKPEVKELKDFSLRNDKNNVDIDRENANLAKNELYYDSVLRSLNDEFRVLRMAVTEGSK
ncbi:MAG: flagellar basal body rod protein FlgB [Candidatus Saccharibacteria bacterium]